MFSLTKFSLVGVLLFCYTGQVFQVGVQSQIQHLDITEDESGINIRIPTQYKSILQLPALAKPKKLLLTKPTPIPQPKKIQRRGIPFQTMYLGVPLNEENEKPGEQIPSGNQYYVPPQVPTMRPLIKPNETEAERAERIHKSFDRLLTFVEIVGQVDNYVSSKWKNLVKTVSNFYEVEDEPYRVSAKRIYGTCPHAN